MVRYDYARWCKETAPVVGEVTAGGGVPEEAGSTERAVEEAVAGGDLQTRDKMVAVWRSLGKPVAEGHGGRLMVVPVADSDAS